MNKQSVLKPNEKPEKLLYHVTDTIFVPRILDKGIQRDFPIKLDGLIDRSEYNRYITTYEELQSLNREDYEFFYQNEYGNYDDRMDVFIESIHEEIDDMEFTNNIKNIFDNLMNNIRYKRYDHLPMHDNSVFFWKQKPTIIKNKQSIIEVDSSLIPCQCYEIESRISDSVYDSITYIYDIGYDIDYCEREEMDEYILYDICDKIYTNANLHYEKMRKYNPILNEKEVEVLCPCDIPNTAIKNVYKKIM